MTTASPIPYDEDRAGGLDSLAGLLHPGEVVLQPDAKIMKPHIWMPSTEKSAEGAISMLATCDRSPCWLLPWRPMGPRRP